jgi:hypothetical protein
MPNVDYDWVKAQLTEAKIKRGPGDAVIKLLETWEQLKIDDPKMMEEALQILGVLAMGHSLLAPYADEVWVEATPGQLKIADEVRIKTDAFQGDTGRVHNGRRGTIVGIRYGDIIVRSTDNKKPLLDGAHYSPFHLEKRVK